MTTPHRPSSSNRSRSLATSEQDETKRIDPRELLARMEDPWREPEPTRVLQLTPELLAIARGETDPPKAAPVRAASSAGSEILDNLACALAALALAVVCWMVFG